MKVKTRPGFPRIVELDIIGETEHENTLLQMLAEKCFEGVSINQNEDPHITDSGTRVTFRFREPDTAKP